jgi:hypothetical protein
MKKESKYTRYLEWALMVVLVFAIFKVSKEFGFVENLAPDTSIGKYVTMIGIVVMAFFVLAVHE